MISKKNKALASGILAAAMSATAIIPSFASAANDFATEGGANESYAKMFQSLYQDVITDGEKNGYLSSSKNGDSFGIPYHAVETLVVEAPDYGHETTSEAMSYIAWITAMHDVLASKGIIEGSTGDLQKGWKTLEAIIPGWSQNAYGYNNVDYSTIWKQASLKADTATEEKEPDLYPATQNGVNAYNPLFDEFKSAYGSDNGYYLMHWLADVDDWYGFGGGSGQFTFINTFQRGEQESCFETVPHGCIEELKYGMTSTQGTGMKGIFNGIGNVPEQYSFTNAPDAEDRAIQAIYFANNFGLDTGDLSTLAGKMGDQCRNDMFDKYYKAIGCQDIGAQSASWDSQHFLMAWYTSWGGALSKTYYGGSYDWAFQIGCSHSHQFYQNPLAAYALAYDTKINAGMTSGSRATEDYKKSLQRQIEFYLWLQSADGPFAGGCTNSKNGKYEKYDASESTFYDMVYVEHPVYADPGSNHWIGNQVWSTQRLAELYYYVKTNGDKASDMKFGGLSLEQALEKLLSRWITWFIDNTEFNYTTEDGTELAYCIPSNLDWSGQPATWNGTYDENANNGLTCTITGYGQSDVGCVSSLCNTLIFYAAANGVPASAAQTDDNSELAAQGLRLANKLMSAQWNASRDEIGLSYTDHNGSLSRVFEQTVAIPSGYNGTMPDGSVIAPGATFSSLRKSYETDAMYQEAKKYYEGQGTDNNGDGTVDINDYEFNLHRFWHMGDALMTTGTMALLYPEVTPINDDSSEEPTTGEETTTAPEETTTAAEETTTSPEETTTASDSETTTGDEDDKGTWGDFNLDGSATIADSVAILQYLANTDEYTPADFDQATKNADIIDRGNGITTDDAFALQKYDAGLIEEGSYLTVDELNAK